MATQTNNTEQPAQKPLYIRLCDIRSYNGNKTLLIYNLTKYVISNGVLCVQRYRGVYKIYVTDDQDRASLLIYGVQYNGKTDNLRI